LHWIGFGKMPDIVLKHSDEWLALDNTLIIMKHV